MGRLTLNPISHIDLFGTILLPFFLIIVGAPFVFGYAKPVPVNFHNLHHPKRDMIWVAGAGPATNILIAVVSIYLLKFLNASGGLLPAFVGTPLALMAQYSVMINAMLAAFNLLPLPPLDGGRVLVGLLPEPYSSAVARIEPYGFLIILVLIMTYTLDDFSSIAHQRTRGVASSAVYDHAGSVARTQSDVQGADQRTGRQGPFDLRVSRLPGAAGGGHRYV